MNETEWLNSQDSTAMWYFIASRLSARKQRLFACACVRRAWPLLPEGPLRRAVSVAERFADERVSIEELRVAMHQADYIAEHLFTTTNDDARIAAAQAAVNCARPHADQAADHTRSNVTSAVYHLATQQGFVGSVVRDMEAAAQCDLLREIVGNPFRPVTVDPRWFRFQDGVVRRVAEGIYESGRFDQLPVLADALEEAGCTEVVLLDHLRSDADHVRGCWLVDLLLVRN